MAAARSTHVVQRCWTFCHRSWCMSEVLRISCHMLIEISDDHCRWQGWCRQPGTWVHGPPVTGAPDMPLYGRPRVTGSQCNRVCVCELVCACVLDTRHRIRTWPRWCTDKRQVLMSSVAAWQLWTLLQCEHLPTASINIHNFLMLESCNYRVAQKNLATDPCEL